MREVRVNLVRREDPGYSVLIGRHILDNVLPEVESLLPGRRVFLVTDSNVRSAGHLASLVGGRSVERFVIHPPGEESKTLDTVRTIIDSMERSALGRDSVLVALGGGVVGDVAGFAAAIFKRGIPLVQIPTTTVAQADSAVGGKVGVDSEFSKNAYGAFKQPARVFVDVSTLASLDDRTYRAGLVESVKHALIAEETYFRYLESSIDRLLRRETDALEEVAERNIRIKAGIVAQDPEERNLRRVLNYGHTIGHAVEAAAGFRMLHGEAVSLGILAAAMIGEEMVLTGSEVGSRAAALLSRLGMPRTIPPHISRGNILENLKRDKKAAGGRPRFVLLDGIGSVHDEGGRYAIEVQDDIIGGAVEALCEKGTRARQ